MSNLRPRDRIAVIALVSLVLIGAYYMLVLKPEQNKVKALDAQIASQRQTLATEQQSYAAGRAALAALRVNTPEWTSLHLAVPAQPDIPALLRTLQRTAATAHVKMQALGLTAASNNTTQPAATGTAASASSPGAATSVPIQLTFAGGYMALDDLLRRVEGYVVVAGDKVHATGPLLSISSVQIGGAPKLQAQISATIYQLPAVSTPGSPAATTIGNQ